MQGRNNRNSNTWSTVESSKKKYRKNEQEVNISTESFKDITVQQSIEQKSKPKYANIIKRDDESGEHFKSDDNGYITGYRTITRDLFRKSVRNKTTRSNNNVSYDVWKYTYFKHILDLSDIFSEGVKKLGIETNTINFLDVFSDFIRECSSGEISPYIEDLDEQTEELYLENAIKRNNF